MYYQFLKLKTNSFTPKYDYLEIILFLFEFSRGAHKIDSLQIMRAPAESFSEVKVVGREAILRIKRHYDADMDS